MIHALPIDAHIDERLAEFHHRLPHGEKVVSMCTTEKYLFIRTEDTSGSHELNFRPKNLLLEEAQMRAQKKK